jgi:hypothetical protein
VQHWAGPWEGGQAAPVPLKHSWDACAPFRTTTLAVQTLGPHTQWFQPALLSRPCLRWTPIVPPSGAGAANGPWASLPCWGAGRDGVGEQLHR